jgi:hypothetical protein
MCCFVIGSDPESVAVFKSYRHWDAMLGFVPASVVLVIAVNSPQLHFVLHEYLWFLNPGGFALRTTGRFVKFRGGKFETALAA